MTGSARSDQITYHFEHAINIFEVGIGEYEKAPFMACLEYFLGERLAT
jgi:hypothetical protein